MRTRRRRPSTARALTCAALLAASVPGCAPAPRFALRPPVVREGDDHSFARRPRATDPMFLQFAIDRGVFAPISRAVGVEVPGPAVDVNSLDEVPDSTWYTNRTPTIEQAAQGACAGVPLPQPPFTIVRGKPGGMTPGFLARDAAGARYVLKTDIMPDEQPELSTGADVVASRLYWALGFNTPCNRAMYVAPSDVEVAPDAYYLNDLGHRHPLGRPAVLRALSHGARRLDGTTRISVSAIVPGEALGAMTDEGVRHDDPNDRVPHQERRELRGERLLAAWVNHWDARVANTLDVYTRDEPGGGGGHVLHYMIDWGDALGGLVLVPEVAARGGLAPMIDLGLFVEDFAGLGFVRRPWDDENHDPVVPMLRVNFDAAHFDPLGWLPLSPPERFADARLDDLAWMARKMARVTQPELAGILDEAHFRDPRVAPRLLDLLMARRDRALRAVFERSSALGELSMAGPDRLCMVDLGIAAGVSTPEGTGYAASLAVGSEGARVEGVVALARGAEPGGVCVDFARHVAPAAAPLSDPARYAVLEITRVERGRRTRLRAHFYDLGPQLGYALVGVERL